MKSLVKPELLAEVIKILLDKDNVSEEKLTRILEAALTPPKTTPYSSEN